MVPAAQVDVAGLKSRLLDHIRSVKDPQVRALLDSIFGDGPFLDAYAACPAAKSYHHGYVGGLIQHSLNMVDLALAVSRNYEGDLDTDMLVAGCLLHDVGKMRQYEVGMSIRYTTDGDYLGHISMGVMMVQERISEVRESGGRVRPGDRTPPGAHNPEPPRGSWSTARRWCRAPPRPWWCTRWTPATPR